MEVRPAWFVKLKGEDIWMKPIEGSDALVCFFNDKEAEYWGEKMGKPYELVKAEMKYEGSGAHETSINEKSE